MWLALARNEWPISFKICCALDSDRLAYSCDCALPMTPSGLLCDMCCCDSCFSSLVEAEFDCMLASTFPGLTKPAWLFGLNYDWLMLSLPQSETSQEEFNFSVNIIGVRRNRDGCCDLSNALMPLLWMTWFFTVCGLLLEFFNSFV